MKTGKALVAGFAVCLAMVGVAFAVTGDFKVIGATYGGDTSGGIVLISGSVNNGAMQSGKTIVVTVSYDYSFEYQTTVETEIPARCPNPADHACNSNPNSTNWRPTTVTTTTTLNTNSSGMLPVTEPVVTNGRVNPKGKTTGYDWVVSAPISSDDSIVPPEVVPVGATLVPGSVEISKVSYTAYLKDPSTGLPIDDTLVSNVLF